MKLKIIIKKNTNLKEEYFKKIALLKGQKWKFRIKSQMEWMKKNLKPLDVHIIIILGKKIVGYTMLRIRNLTINQKTRCKYIYFDTHIVDKKYRGKLINNKRISKILMNKSKEIIKKKKLIGILHCEKKLVNYYLRNSWKVVKKGKIKIKKKNKAFILVFPKIKQNFNYDFKL